MKTKTKKKTGSFS